MRNTSLHNMCTVKIGFACERVNETGDPCMCAGGYGAWGIVCMVWVHGVCVHGDNGGYCRFKTMG